MMFALDFWDISLLLAATAMVPLITSELTSPNYGKRNIKINHKRLKTTALFFSILFLGTVAVRIANIIFNM